ncbi:hypothetical protein L9F63_023418, partial [Diploptera punctata]
MSEKTVSPLKYFISGGFGGLCTVVSGHPFDTIKVRLQTMPKPAAGEAPMYTGALDCVTKTVRREGILGLYKGMGAPIAAVAPIFAMSFLGYGIGKRLQMKDPSDQLTHKQLFIAGAFSGLFTTVVMAPGERIKCLLQIQQGGTEPQKYKGPVDALKQLYREGGITNLYRGTCATLLRDMPGSGMYFLGYEVVQELMNPTGKTDIGMLASILGGGTAGLAMWITCMPADVLKSRFQTAPPGKYTGVRDVFKQLIKEEGVKALYKGLTPVMLRAFPANAACFFGFELSGKLNLDLI